jgi:type IV secretory pathway TrbD component
VGLGLLSKMLHTLTSTYVLSRHLITLCCCWGVIAVIALLRRRRLPICRPSGIRIGGRRSIAALLPRVLRGAVLRLGVILRLLILRLLVWILHLLVLVLWLMALRMLVLLRLLPAVLRIVRPSVSADRRRLRLVDDGTAIDADTSDATLFQPAF